MAEYIDREKLLKQIDNRVNAFYDEEMNIKDMCYQKKKHKQKPII